MMYFYWKHKGIRPSVFYNMPKGELIVIEAFFQKEVSERNEAMKASEGKAICPLWLLQ